MERKSPKQNGLKENCRGRLAALISKGLKPIPTGAFDLHAVLNEFPVDLNKINGTVNSDLDFGRRVLRLSNAVLDRSQQCAPTIADAAVLLGSVLFHAAVILCAVTEFDSPEYRDQNAEFLWSHSLHIGVLAEEIARHTDFPFRGMAFLGGLLHDIGYLPLLQVVREQENPGRELAKIPWQDNLDLERELFGLDHCIVGRWMAKSWEFSPSLVDAIWHHHDPSNAEQDRRLAEIVCEAKYHCADSSLQ